MKCRSPKKVVSGHEDARGRTRDFAGFSLATIEPKHRAPFKALAGAALQLSILNSLNLEPFFVRSLLLKKILT
jgi:hypothetical protein